MSDLHAAMIGFDVAGPGRLSARTAAQLAAASGLPEPISLILVGLLGLSLLG